jgi:hypothetical protein
VRIDDLHALDGAEPALLRRFEVGPVDALEGELDRGGVEGLAIVEGHARTELDLPHLLAHEPVRGRERGNELELLVARQQRVVDRRVDDERHDVVGHLHVEELGVDALGDRDVALARRPHQVGRRAAIVTKTARMVARHWKILRIEPPTPKWSALAAKVGMEPEERPDGMSREQGCQAGLTPVNGRPPCRVDSRWRYRTDPDSTSARSDTGSAAVR